MFLKRVEIQGFKSFANKVEVELQGGITGVVGPNGSGKSNIADAIRWVLGEQSAKTLRGSKMEDIIFSGTETRKPLGYADVTLVLDNKDKRLKVDYSEVCVTRRVFRSGDSEYYINKTNCRLKDIRELFMDTGVGKDGYSIIGQGKIDEILSTKSDDRRLLFEEAAGIVKHKTRKVESEKKLEKTKDNLLRLSDIISELETQVEPLKEQSEKAKEYNKFSGQLRELEVNLFIREIDRLKEQLEHLDNQKDLIDKQVTYNENKRDELEEKYSKVNAEVEAMDEKIEELQNLNYNAKSDLEKNEGDLKLYNEKLGTNEREISRITKDIEDLQQESEMTKGEREKLDLEKLKLSDKIQELESENSNKNQEHQEININIEEEERDIESRKADVIEIFNAIAEKKSKINGLLSFKQNIDKRIKQIHDEVFQLIENKKNSEIDINNTSEQISSTKAELIKLKVDRDTNVRKKDEVNQSLSRINTDLNRLGGEIQGKISKYNLLRDMKSEYEGFYSSVKNALLATKQNSQLGRGVKGVIAELLQVDKKYERAIEVALGSSIQNIVTETPEDAKRIIDHLKANKLGRVTFLPMTSIKGREINSNETSLIKSNGVLGVASDLIVYDKSYNNIFKSLLGRTLVVEDIETGIKVSKMCNHSMRIVSLEGDIMNPGGSMTGGSYKTNNTNLLGRERQIKELDKDIINLRDELTTLQGNERTQKIVLTKLESYLSTISNDINEGNIDVAKMENKQKQIKEELDRIEGLIEKYNNEEEQLSTEEQEAHGEIEKIRSEIEELTNKNELTQGNITSRTKNFELARLRKNSLIEEITNIKVTVASYRQELIAIEDSSKKLSDEESILLKKINDKKQEASMCKVTLEKINSEFENLKELKNKLNSDLLEYELNLKEVKGHRSNFMQTFYGEQNKLKEMNRKINDLQKSLNTIDAKHAKYNVQLETFNNKLWDEYDMSYQMALKYKSQIDNVAKTQKEIRDIKQTIKALGTVNTGAVDEYLRVKERYEFLTDQKNDLLDARESLRKIIDDLEDKMRQQFIEKFSIIKENFQEVFNKLFAGGKADVYLADDKNILTSGIEIVAQPPGKKLQNLSLLSGGERALTAIALLFAILKTKPTPFCVLDEIEAALDDANVYRFADFLKEFSKETQFIVITHRKGTMEAVDSLYGVTMEEKGVSNLISVKLTDKLIEKVS